MRFVSVSRAVGAEVVKAVARLGWDLDADAGPGQTLVVAGPA